MVGRARRGQEFHLEGREKSGGPTGGPGVFGGPLIGPAWVVKTFWRAIRD